MLLIIQVSTVPLKAWLVIQLLVRTVRTAPLAHRSLLLSSVPSGSTAPLEVAFPSLALQAPSPTPPGGTDVMLVLMAFTASLWNLKGTSQLATVFVLRDTIAQRELV